MNNTINHSEFDPRYGFMIQDSDEYNIRIYPMGMNNMCWDQDQGQDQDQDQDQDLAQDSIRDEHDSSNCGLFVYSLSEDNLDDNITDINDNSNNVNETRISKIKKSNKKIEYLKYKLPTTKHKCKLPNSEIPEISEYFVSSNPNIYVYFYIIIISIILWIIIIKF
jgi:hypothetical protein